MGDENVIGYGHVPTNYESPANDVVDDFVAGVLSTNAPNSGALGLSYRRPVPDAGFGGRGPWYW